MSIGYAAGEGSSPETEFAELAQRPLHGLIIHIDSVLYSRIRTIIALAAQYSIPTMYELSPIFGDGLNGQAAAFLGSAASDFPATSIPSLNFTPRMIFGNRS